MDHHNNKINLDELRRMSGITDVEIEINADDLASVDHQYIKADFDELLKFYIEEIIQKGKERNSRYPQYFQRDFLFDEVDPNDLTDEEILQGWDWRADIFPRPPKH